MNGATLAMEDVSVAYGERLALRQVSFEARGGEVVALAGPNGSGKSTLLRSALGLEQPQRGAVRLGGSALDQLDLRARARRAAWMPQEEPAGDNLPVIDYVRYGRFPYLAPWASETAGDLAAVDRALDRAGASELRERRVWELSGGERQRVRLARVFAQEAPLLLLDEPTAHLDIGHQLEVLERVRAIAREGRTAVVVALHDLNLAARFADRVVVLHRGRVIANGLPAEVLSASLLRDVWGIASELRVDPRTQLPYLIPRTIEEPASEPRVRASRTRIHLMAGGGSGGDILRRLVDAGLSVSAGVLPLFDSDTAVAEELHVPTVLEVPFAPISETTRERLRGVLAETSIVVVAPFPVGPANLANLEELRDYPRPDRIFFLAQTAGRDWDYTGGTAAALRAEVLGRGALELRDTEAVLERLALRAPAESAEGFGPRRDERR